MKATKMRSNTCQRQELLNVNLSLFIVNNTLELQINIVFFPLKNVTCSFIRTTSKLKETLVYLTDELIGHCGVRHDDRVTQRDTCKT